ncbi:hypothetical protein [Streptomyces eurythermus]
MSASKYSEGAEPTRIAERDVRRGDIKYLAQIDVDQVALEERWGKPDVVQDDLAEWVCFAFSLSENEVFLLQREADHPPAPGFILSVTRILFSAEAASKIAGALGIPRAQVTHVNAEANP